MELSQTDTNNLIFIGLLFPIIIGIVLGWQKRIVIFNNYDDLGLTFLSFIIPFPAFLIYGYLGQSKITLYFFLTLELILVLYLIYRSFIDNQKNIFYTFLALYTKFPISFIYLLNLLSVLDNLLNKNKRNKSLLSVIFLFVLTPILTKLIKNKSGVLNNV